MDDSYLESLALALGASPQNLALRMTLVRGYFDNNQIEKAYQLLAAGGFIVSHLDKDNLLAAGVCLAYDEAEQALEFLDSDEPQAQLFKAKALLKLNKLEQAQACYQAAVAGNASLEDTELATQLKATVVAQTNERKVKLRVISNDDTDDVEVTRLIQPPEEKLTFADVGGLAEVKKQIRKKIITPFLKPSLFQRFKKKVGGGILLYGPPGCGKTLLARATAGECDAQFINVAISDILDMYIGESERKLHAIFEQARSQTPTVIFFDEIEALAAKRQHTREATSAKLVSQFLSETGRFCAKQ